MRAVVCDGPGSVTLREIPAPQPAAGEVVVRVEAALTCGTDLKLLRRGHPKFPFPIVLGHELAGTVESVGEGVTAFLPGERVTTAVSGGCARCPDCRAGNENLCATAFDRPVFGAFAELVRIPERVARRGLRRLPGDLGFEEGALLDPLASVVRGLKRAPAPPGGTVLLFGAGPIALLFTALLVRSGVERVLVAGRRAGRLEALRSLGAQPIDRRAVSVRAALREATHGRGADLVIDTTGDAGIVADAVELTARGGTILLFAGMPGGTSLSIDAGRVHYDEVSIVGSFHYVPSETSRALELLAEGAVPVGLILSGHATLEEFEGVFRSQLRGEGMKTCFQPGRRGAVTRTLPIRATFE